MIEDIELELVIHINKTALSPGLLGECGLNIELYRVELGVQTAM